MQVWLELLVALLMVPLLSLIHGSGLMAMSNLFNLTDEALIRKKLSWRTIWLVALLAVLLFGLHGLEITLVAGFYRSVGAAPSLEQALFFSASAYTSAGSGPDRLPDGWKLLGEAETLLGLLLIGWSTAFLVSKLERLQEEDRSSPQAVRRRRLRGATGFGGHEEESGMD